MNSQKDILIIDDEQVIIDAIQRIIEFENLTCDSSLSVDEALNKINSNSYKLIICDIMMPGKTGFELLEILHNKKIPTPVIITTGFSTLENAVKSLFEGAIGFIPKPFTIDELISIIQRGLVYNKILKDKYNPKTFLKEKFIACPVNYYRLGYDSWMKKDLEGCVKIGLTDCFLKSVGMIESIELLKIEETIFQGSTCAKIIDSNELIHQLLSPIGGKIIGFNDNLLMDNSLLEKDPYFEGWIYRILPNNLDYEIKNLTTCNMDI